MAKKKAKKAAKKTEILVVQSKVREYVKGSKGEFNVGSDFVPELSARLERMLDDAMRRAKDNGRKTLKGRDV